MCDYSLHAVASRPAQVGETLTTTQFHGTFTKGLSSPTEPGVAVCILPGTQVAFAEPPRAQFMRPRDGFVNNTKRIIKLAENMSQPVGTFVKVDPHLRDRHHDAFEFLDGSIVLVSDLEPGQELQVLWNPAEKPDNHHHDEPAHAMRVSEHV